LPYSLSDRISLPETIGWSARESGLVEQSADPADQRQKLLRLTDDARRLWESMADRWTSATTSRSRTSSR
jgi:hypothetical protein